MMRASILTGSNPVQWTIFQYDGDNQRIARWNDTGTAVTIVGSAGQPLSEYNFQNEWMRDSIYMGTQLLATVRPASGGTLTLQDLLGTWWIYGDGEWRSCSIVDEGGGQLLITNEWNEQTHGTWDPGSRTITAGPEWGYLVNDVTANVNRLLWHNDTIWVRGTNPIPDQFTFEYYHLDMLGSVRAVTDHAGQTFARHDYLPFGEGPGVTSSGEKQRFTGKERDVETYLDYFGARYARSTMGRFLTVDPVMNVQAAMVEPQRWNRYVYVVDNPLVRLDPDGRDVVNFLKGVAVGAGGMVVGLVEALGRHLANDPTLYPEMGMAMYEDVKLLGYGLANPGEVVDQVGRMVSGGPGDHYELGQITGQVATAVALARAGARAAAVEASTAAATRFAAEIRVGLASGGPSTELVTSLTQAPAAGRALSAAAGDGARELAQAARANGQMYSATIPTSVLVALERAGLLRISRTMINGQVGTEYRFLPGAMEYLAPYFKPMSK